MVWGRDGVWHRDPSWGFPAIAPHPAPEQTLPHRTHPPRTPARAPGCWPGVGTGLEGWARGQATPGGTHSYPVPAPQQNFLEHPRGRLQGGERQEGPQSHRQRRVQQQLGQAPQEQPYLLGRSGRSLGPAAGLSRSSPAPPSLPQGCTAGAAVTPPSMGTLDCRHHQAAWPPACPCTGSAARRFPSQLQGTCDGDGFFPGSHWKRCREAGMGGCRKGAVTGGCRAASWGARFCHTGVCQCLGISSAT